MLHKWRCVLFYEWLRFSVAMPVSMNNPFLDMSSGMSLYVLFLYLHSPYDNCTFDPFFFVQYITSVNQLSIIYPSLFYFSFYSLYSSESSFIQRGLLCSAIRFHHFSVFMIGIIRSKWQREFTVIFNLSVNKAEFCISCSRELLFALFPACIGVLLTDFESVPFDRIFLLCILAQSRISVHYVLSFLIPCIKNVSYFSDRWVGGD